MVNMRFTRSRERVVAVCDIGVGGASAAILALRGESAAEVLATGHSTLSLEARSPDQAIGMISAQIKEACEAALASYTEKGHRMPVTSVYGVIHAPWMTTRVLRAGEIYGDEEYIHDAMVGKLAQQALANAQDLDRSRLLEASVVRVELNGYATARPGGKHAHAVDVVSLASECNAEVRTSAETALHSVFPVAAITWRSGIRALMTFARESAVPSSHYLIVDMGVDSTHLVSVRGASFEQRIVPEGIRTILARVGGNASADQMLGSLRMLTRDACSTAECEAMQKAIALSEPELVHVFGEAIGQMATNRRMANDLLLITHPDLEPWLARFFSRIDFAQFTVTTLPFTICAPSSIHMDTWVTGEATEDSLAVGASLVNIESRA
jgi:hypothetical protein